MLKYKLKGTPIESFSFSYLRDYLISLGITKPESFIGKPALEDEETYRNLDNIEEAIDILYEGFTNKKKFFLQVDSDVDGYTSSAIFYAFFKKLYPEAHIEFRLHEGKEHGMILSEIPIESDIIVIPDAGSMQIDEQEKLNAQGRKVVILDHHRADNYIVMENVTIVNNQLSDKFRNKYLSGAGVVYKTIQAFSDKYLAGNTIYRDYTDLAALGIISDMMDTRELDNNFIIKMGLNNIKNPMLIALLEKQEYSISNILKPTKIDIAFYVAPIINGVIRFGDEEEKTNLFKAFTTYDSNKMIETVYHGNKRVEHFYDYIARTSYNVKERQNRQKLKALEFLAQKIEKEKLNENQLIILTVSKDEVPQTITGLVAMEILKKYKKPTLVLRPKEFDGEPGFAGSGRGKANSDFDSLFDFLRGSGLCEFVEGHDMAHGVGVKAKNLEKLVEYANENLSHIEFDVEEMEVDYIFTNGSINRDMIKEFGEHIDIYGNQIPQPKFAFELNLSKSMFKFLGQKQDTIKFSVGGVDFIMFKKRDLVDFISESPSDIFNLKVVGRSQINEWNGHKYPQIMIDGYDIEEVKLEQLF